MAGGYAPFTSPISWTRDLAKHVTLIDGSDLSSTLIITGRATVILQGLTIVHGRAPQGGGLSIYEATAHITDCILRNNQAIGPDAIGRGGGLYAANATVQITNSQIISNTAEAWGGGIYLADAASMISHTLIAQNAVMWDGGGGLYAFRSQLDISDSQILENAAGCCGGGIGADFATLMLQHNLIARNQVNAASYPGGGLYAINSTGTIAANRVIANRAMVGGGITLGENNYEALNNLVSGNSGGGILMYKGRLINNTIRDNHANDSGEFGDGVLVSALAASAVVTITHNIIAGNVYGIGNLQADAYISLRLNDVWGNQIADYAGLTADPSDISIDPAIEPGGDDSYHLRADSPCIDIATNDDAPAFDLDGDLRPLDGNGDGIAVADVGADEYISGIIATPTTSPTPSDTPTATPTCDGSATPTPSPADTPTETATPTPTTTWTPTTTEPPTASPSCTTDATEIPTLTATLAMSPTPSCTPSTTPTPPTPTATPTPTPPRFERYLPLIVK